MTRIALLILILALPLLGQGIADAWGDHVYMGRTFQSTDSLRIGVNADGKINYADSLQGNDVLYSNKLDITERADGKYVVAITLDEIASAGAIDVTYWVRLYYGSYYQSRSIESAQSPYTSVDEWDDWHQIGGNLAANTLYVFNIADSSWWRPASGLQYRLIDASAGDTVRHFIREFRK